MIAGSLRTIVDKAVDGAELTAAEVRQLFAVPGISEEAYLIQHASRVVSEAASGGKAEVHAQVGIDLGPCGKNCAFCSFAARNGIFKGSQALAAEDVIARCQTFERDGANAIYLMATAHFRFEDFLDIGRAVRENLKPETVLIANVPDFNEDQADAIRSAGFTGIYHAVRMGEGVATGIRPARRLQTMQAARKAGLLLGTCVEPVGPEHDLDELVEKTLLARELDPVFSGSARRISIPGTDLAARGMVTEAAMAHILAVVRLATGSRVSGNCTHEPNGIGAMAGANLFWAENGTNPRDVSEQTETNRGCSVADCRSIFREAGWNVLDGPSQMFNSKL